MLNIFNKIKNLFVSKVSYTPEDLEEVDGEIRFFYEKMVTAFSFNEQSMYNEILKELDAKYNKIHKHLYG